MSVQTLDIKVFNYLRAGIERSAYNSEINQWYFYSIRRYFNDKDIETEAERLVKSWADLNELSYCKKYKENTHSMSEFIQRDYTHKPLNLIQFIKYLDCLIYNIEIEHFTLTDQQIKDFELLKKLQRDAISAYISNLEEYKNSSWSE